MRPLPSDRCVKRSEMALKGRHFGATKGRQGEVKGQRLQRPRFSSDDDLRVRDREHLAP
jgi:hypothetical protein